MSSARATLETVRRTMEHTGPSVNVGDKERLISLLAGGALGLYGLSRFSLGGLALAVAGGSLIYRGMSGHCLLYHALDVSTATPHDSATRIHAGHGVKIDERIVINRDAATLWRQWRKLDNLGRIMNHLERVEEIDGRRSRWTARGPMNIPLHWEAEIINEKENEMIAWRSTAGSPIDTAGSVHFRALPEGHGTEVRVTLKYDAHAAQWAAPLARWMGHAPEQQIRDDLQRFKQQMEAGEKAKSSH